MEAREVEVLAETARLSGTLTLPEHPGGVIVFAHGSGSSRFSPRNRAVAGVLNRAGFASLLGLGLAFAFMTLGWLAGYAVLVARARRWSSAGACAAAWTRSPARCW